MFQDYGDINLSADAIESRMNTSMLQEKKKAFTAIIKGKYSSLSSGNNFSFLGT